MTKHFDYMKPEKIFLLLLCCIFFISCGEDRRKEYAHLTARGHWIEQTMREHYYWYEDMPAPEKINFFEKPATLFPKLLSKKDGNGSSYFYSTIEVLEEPESETRSIANPQRSYGFDFSIYPINNNKKAALVHYVVDNSPAKEVGLERGTWILKVGGEEVSEKNVSKLIGGGEIMIARGKYEAETNKLELTDSVKLPAAREVIDNPVQLYKVFTVNGKNVGYLVYNHFTAGRQDGDESYNENLRQASQYFKQAGVTEFVLDLRYNNGGSVSCAILMSAILGPQEMLDNRIGYMEFNDKQNPRTTDLTANRSLLGNGANLDLRKLYVLTSMNTASASEMVINSLKPYMDEIILIGEKTEGKNVGSRSFDSADHPDVILHPIVCKIYNNEDKSDYENGFSPTHEIKETFSDTYLPLGNQSETLLNAALRLINGESITEEETSRSNVMVPIRSSLERRATNGVLLK